MISLNSKFAAGILIAASVLIGAGFWAHHPAAANAEAVAEAEDSTTSAHQPAREEETVYSGRVVGPDRQPVANARLFLSLPSSYVERLPPSAQLATSDRMGAFHFRVAKANLGGTRRMVVATADGFGPAWTDAENEDKTEGLTLTLVRDDVPISGRVLDLEGRPIPGATVRLREILTAKEGDLGKWLEATKASRGERCNVEKLHLSRPIFTADIPGLKAAVTTDADGRFHLTGLGRERVVGAFIEGPTIATREVRFVTRSMEILHVPEGRSPEWGTMTYCGPNGTHTAAPTKVVTGTIRDKDSGKPLAGVRIQSDALAGNPLHGRSFLETVTDTEGRYCLVGMPKGVGNKIVAVPRDDQPHLATRANVADTPAFDPVTVDFVLKRGVWITGRVRDKKTGKPQSGAALEYYAMSDNPHLKDYERLAGPHSTHRWQRTAQDGTFRVVGLPGPGVLAVQATDWYLLAHQRDDDEAAKEPFLNTSPYALTAISYNAVARVDPPRGAETLSRDVTLDPGLTVQGRVVDPDGRPIAGWRSYGLTGWSPWDRPEKSTETFTVRAFNPSRPRHISFQHLERGLVGEFPPPRDGNAEVTVRLSPGAVVTGRLVDRDGRPRGGLEVSLMFRAPRAEAWSEYSPAKVTTDGEGRVQEQLPGGKRNTNLH